MFFPKKETKNTLHKFITKVSALVALVIILLPPISTSAESLEQQLTNINNEKATINAKLKDLNGQKKTLANELAIFDNQIYAIQLQIDATQAEIDLTNKNIDETNVKISQAESDLKKQKEILSEYLKVMYIEGQSSTIELIASSNTFSEFVDRSEYLSTMQEKVKETADKIVAIKADLETKKKDLEVKKAKAEDLKNEQVAQRSGIDNQRYAKNQLLSETKGTESEYKKKLTSLAQKEAAVWAAYEAATRNATGSNGSSYHGGSGSGYMIWPSSGSLTQGYGMTDFALSGAYNGKIHNGLDISCGYACPIHAAASGVVMDEGYEANSGGWGNWIAIKHPNGLVTLYGHQSSFSVSPGQAVVQGQVIGYEGNTGFSTGSHLHFSVFTNFTLYNTGGYHGPAYEVTANPYEFL